MSSEAAGYTQQTEEVDAQLASALEVAEVEEMVANLEDGSGSSSDGSDGSDSEASTEEENVDVKSTDGQDKSGGGGDDKSPKPDGSSSAIASSSTPDVVDIAVALESLTIENSKEMLANQKQKAVKEVENLKSLAKQLKKLKREEKQIMAEELKKQKSDMMKEQRHEARERMITINVEMNGEMKATTVAMKFTGAMLRDEVARIFGITVKKHIKKMRLLLAGRNLLDNPRRTLAMQMALDGCVIYASFPISGGAGKKRSKDVTGEDFQFNITPPDLVAGELDIVKQAFQLRGVNIAGWVESLNLVEASSLLQVIEEQPKTGMTRSRINPYMPFVKEFNDLEARTRFFKKCMSENHFRQAHPSVKLIFVKHTPQ